MATSSTTRLMLAGAAILAVAWYLGPSPTLGWSTVARAALREAVPEFGFAGLRGLEDDEDEKEEPLGPPPIYDKLRDARLDHAGHIRDGRLRKERFDLEFTDGDLYLLAPVAGRVTGAVFLGNGQLRFYPPDAVEHHQLEKFLDAASLEESFDRVVFRFSDDTAERLQALAEPSREVDVKKANNLFEDRREELLKRQLVNPDSRLLADLLAAPADIDSGDSLNPSSDAPAGRGYFLAEIDGKKHDWITIAVEPRNLEEVQIFRFDPGRKIRDIWSSFHSIGDFRTGTLADPFTAPPPKSNESDGSDYDKEPEPDLPPRPAVPDREGWSEQARVPRVDVDLALESDGDAKATAAIVIEALQPMAAVRLNISPFLEVTDVRWVARDDARMDDPERSDGAEDTTAEENSAAEPDPSEPTPLSGERLYFVQEKHNRRMSEDLYEPWVTVELPHRADAGERFTLEFAYEGKLVEQLWSTRDFFLRDTLHWYPRHPDARRSSFRLTFRVPERYQIASGGKLVDDRVEEKTRIVRWVAEEPVRSMSFNYGRFEVSDVEMDEIPPISIYSSRNHIGFAPGNREKTIQDLASAIRVYSDYFGPFPFPSLLVTETPALGGEAFPGFLLLSFQTFGELHTGEAELLRSHEVAHQWWGAAIDWDTYRDQWLSEGFAQYAAALYVLVGLEDESQFRQMMDAWRLDVLGEVSVGQGIGLRHYGFRPEIIRKSDGSNSGSLILGSRLTSTETPNDYRILVYEKGAYVLHMLRMMLMDVKSEDDGPYARMMRRFADDHLHGIANTRAFEQTVTAAFGEPMDWFFDQWVYGVDVPTYRPDLEVVPTGSGDAPFALRGSIAQENVPDGFRMPVPIRMTFNDRSPLIHRIWVDADRVEVDLPLPARPSDIEVNYLNAVLARIR